MLGIEIIEVAIGLSLTYLALAVLCSSIIEIIVKLTNYRATMLKGALIKLLGHTGGKKKSSVVTATIDLFYKHHKVHGKVMDRDKKPDYISKEDFATALIDSFASLKPDSEKFEAVKNAVGRIPDEKLRLQILGFLDESMGDLVAFKAKMANWFDSSMNDVSAWFKSRMRIFVSAAAAVVVVSLNVDSFELADKLYKDDNLREATMNAAAEYIKSDTVALNPDSTKSLSAMVTDVDSMIDKIKMLPIGWDNEQYPWEKGKTCWEDIKLTFSKFFGLLITIAAVGMGAPYWRDQVKGLMSYRFSGKPAASSGQSPEPAAPVTIVNNIGQAPKPKEGEGEDKAPDDEPDTVIV